MMLDAIRLMVFPALMAFAASSDFLTMTIPNKVSLLLVAGFLALALMSGMSMSDLGWHLGAGALVLTVAFIFFAFGWIGGGDAKLAAAIALWFGFEQLMSYLIYASLIGGVLTLMIITARLMPLPGFLQGRGWAERLYSKTERIPYGIALAIGALLVYPDTMWMKAAGT
jgi:prepilin peptidase CpaA